MSVFTYHLVKTNFLSALKLLFFPPKPKKTDGLIHIELMTAMTLGSKVYSPSRFLIRQIVVFAQWDNEAGIERFLEQNTFGKRLTKGWHVRLKFLRQWGKINGFKIPKPNEDFNESNDTVVAVTIARMKLLAVPRFIRWGRPVEKLVRDHPGTTLSLASMRLPNTVSTFSIWKSTKEMTNMVHGHSNVPKPKRHAQAMKERERKNFHYQFTTLRFKTISEHGEWKGEKGYTMRGQ